MDINLTIEVSTALTNDKFFSVFENRMGIGGIIPREDDEYIDTSKVGDGMVVIFRESQYKKKIRVLFNEAVLIGGDADNEKLLKKMGKRIDRYFDGQMTLSDFALTEVHFISNIGVGSPDRVLNYIDAIKRTGKVKGFSPIHYDELSESRSFCLRGNSNGISFIMCPNPESRNIRKDCIHTEIRLEKQGAIRDYTGAGTLEEQVMEISRKKQEIYFEIFARIVPFGDFYKKKKADEIVCRNVSNMRIRKKMLRLLALVPQKKSLLLAQKELNCRDITPIMVEFAKINLSPVTLSKRMQTKHLACLYEMMDVGI